MNKILNYSFTLLVIIASTAGLLATRGWPAATALFPRSVGTLTLLVAIVILLRDVLDGRREARQGVANAATDDSAAIFAAVALRFAWLVAFVAAIWSLGLVAAIFLFVLGFMAVQGQYPWRKSLIFAAATAGMVYLIFNLAFKVVWPAGALPALWF
jgi:hypothetical protein